MLKKLDVSRKIMMLRIKNVLLRRASLGFLFIFFFGGVFFFWVGSFRIPDFTSFEERKVQSSTKIYDRTEKILLYDVHENIRRTVIPGSEMGANIKNATVAIEDSSFYEHKGVRPLSFLRAVFANLGTGSFSQGGSTITQQVIKNTLLTKDKSISRKIKEWFLAIKLEKVMTKDEILALYLNEAPYGGNIYGIAEASHSFFGKEPKDLSLPEAAYLAALPQAPTFYSPHGNNRTRLDERKNLVLRRMFELGFISEEEKSEAEKAPVTFLPNAQITTKAMHFVLYVREYLEEKYGRDALESGGFRVVTTLDYVLQEKAEVIVKKHALENEKNFNAKNASLVAIDPKTGQILTMVGSRDYFDKSIEGNFNVSVAHRQPGSAFKPFVYATAFKKGYTPETVVFDLPTEFQTTCTPEGKPMRGTKEEDCYMPVNYDGKYHGPISFRDALAQSINIPAIKVLYLAGLKDSLKTAKDMGIKSLSEPDRYGLTLVLGGGEVSLLDITSAYGVFGNNGVREAPTPILKIEDINGSVLEEYRNRPVEVLDKNIALLVNDILSDETARAPAFGSRSPLYVSGYDVAVKTGTTNDYHDAWIIGYSPSLSVGAWAGNNDNKPMEKRVARFIIAPLWHEFVVEALKTVPNEKFEQPKPTDKSIKPILRGFWQGNETFTIDTITGKLATERTPEKTKEERPLTNVHSILYWVDKNNPLGPKPENPEKDLQFNLWEVPIQKWLKGRTILGYSAENIPSEVDDVHTEEFSPKIEIVEPVNNQEVSVGASLLVKTRTTNKFPIQKLEYYLNNVFVGESLNGSAFSLKLDSFDLNFNENKLKVVAYDSAYNKGEVEVNLIIKD